MLPERPIFLVSSSCLNNCLLTSISKNSFLQMPRWLAMWARFLLPSQFLEMHFQCFVYINSSTSWAEYFSVIIPDIIFNSHDKSFEFISLLPSKSVKAVCNILQHDNNFSFVYDVIFWISYKNSKIRLCSFNCSNLSEIELIAWSKALN